MKVYIGIDCGATNMRVGVFNEAGNLKFCSKTKSSLKRDSSQFAKEVKDLVTQIVPAGFDFSLSGVGVGTPGPLDLEKGLILPSANLHNSEPIDLKGQFDSAFNVPIHLDRDTNAALLGEVWQGAAVGLTDVVMLTLGSGVGGAVMVNGEIERGAHGQAGEIGHMFIQISENQSIGGSEILRCGLGHEGCFEALINSTQDLEEFATYLGYGLANIVDIFNPQKIIIGGGKLHLGDFLPKAIEVMKSQALKGPVDEVEVVYAKLKELSGMYGAAFLAIDGKEVQ
jgi:glucokinase